MIKAISLAPHWPPQSQLLQDCELSLSGFIAMASCLLARAIELFNLQKLSLELLVDSLTPDQF